MCSTPNTLRYVRRGSNIRCYKTELNDMRTGEGVRGKGGRGKGEGGKGERSTKNPELSMGTNIRVILQANRYFDETFPLPQDFRKHKVGGKRYVDSITLLAMCLFLPFLSFHSPYNLCHAHTTTIFLRALSLTHISRWSHARNKV